MYSDTQVMQVLLALVPFIALCIAMFAFIIKSCSGDEKRPHSGLLDSNSKILHALDNLASKIPGFSEEDMELSRMQGSFVTAASLPPTWEAVLRSFKDHGLVITPDAATNWRLDNVFDAYYEMRSVATKTERVTSPSFEGFGGDSHDFKMTVYLTLKFHPLNSSGTRIDFQYRLLGARPIEYACSMVYFTNKSLKQICENLTINPAVYGF
jgi:hypothetical protein